MFKRGNRNTETFIIVFEAGKTQFIIDQAPIKKHSQPQYTTVLLFLSQYDFPFHLCFICLVFFLKQNPVLILIKNHKAPITRHKEEQLHLHFSESLPLDVFHVYIYLKLKLFGLQPVALRNKCKRSNKQRRSKNDILDVVNHSNH